MHETFLTTGYAAGQVDNSYFKIQKKQKDSKGLIPDLHVEQLLANSPTESPLER